MPQKEVYELYTVAYHTCEINLSLILCVKQEFLGLFYDIFYWTDYIVGRNVRNTFGQKVLFSPVSPNDTVAPKKLPPKNPLAPHISCTIIATTLQLYSHITYQPVLL